MLRRKREWAPLWAFVLALAMPWAGLGANRHFTRPLPALGEAEVPADGQKKLIALTFDDGPRRSTTTQLLDGLAQRGVRATFFLIGEQVEGNEDLVERMVSEGHQVGMHTYGHTCLTGLNDRDFYSEVERCRSVLAELTGGRPLALRPPYGLVDAGVTGRAGSPIILWSIDPEDWKYKDAQRIRTHVAERASDGDIILLHDIYPTSVEGALAIVDDLHEQGYLFVTVEELAAERHVELEQGETYLKFAP